MKPSIFADAVGILDTKTKPAFGLWWGRSDQIQRLSSARQGAVVWNIHGL